MSAIHLGITTAIDLIYEISNRLVQANTVQEQLDAIRVYAMTRGSTGARIFYIVDPESDENTHIEVVAEWVAKDHPTMGIGVQLPITDYLFGKHISVLPVTAELVHDVDTHDEMNTASRALCEQVGVKAIAQLPLYNRGRWLGAIVFSWDTPQVFTANDEHVYTLYTLLA